jgi:hypothetical protein
MSDTVEFLIAQHAPDLFRQEVRNIGVFGFRGREAAARFLGETRPGELDGRTLRTFSHPDVYRQWVDYWRSLLGRPERSVELLLAATGQHYRLVRGGDLTETAEDSMGNVVNYLYSALVSEGGMAEAIGAGEESDLAVARLRDEIGEALDEANLLAHESGTDLFTVSHPVRRNHPVKGSASEPHRPAFVQENGHLYVIEAVDFTSTRREAAKDHAGWAAYMFKDILAARRDTAQAISVVRCRVEDEDHESVRYAMGLLRRESEVIDWLNSEERGRFIQARVEAGR